MMMITTTMTKSPKSLITSHYIVYTLNTTVRLFPKILNLAPSYLKDKSC